jgi:hypothetical protein
MENTTHFGFKEDATQDKQSMFCFSLDFGSVLTVWDVLFFIRFWNCSDCGMFCFSLDFGTVLTVWYFFYSLDFGTVLTKHPTQSEQFQNLMKNETSHSQNSSKI